MIFQIGALQGVGIGLAYQRRGHSTVVRLEHTRLGWGGASQAQENTGAKAKGMSFLKPFDGSLLFKGLSPSFFARLARHYGIFPWVTALRPPLTPSLRPAAPSDFPLLL